MYELYDRYNPDAKGLARSKGCRESIDKRLINIARGRLHSQWCGLLPVLSLQAAVYVFRI